jgi:hypothetical protein
MYDTHFCTDDVHFCTLDYSISHGLKPRGFGDWAFDFANGFIDGREPRIEFAPLGSYADAKRWAANRAVKLGIRCVKVCPWPDLSKRPPSSF